MGNPLEVWVYAVANLGFVAVSGLLLGLSLIAYRRRTEARSYGLAALGFGCVVAGGVFEAVYTLWFDANTAFTNAEFLYLQAGEDLLLAIGFGFLFYAIIRHGAHPSTTDEYAAWKDEEVRWKTERSHDE